ncbi:MAG: TlpA family protein disulfide reductase [Planctomycetaceae bacterium]|jgi:thiol-disulfide isomerase/thioredoxin|nr:TlpA family protein disulfide reductase [Planctomycetaceae bacterium]
MKIKIYFNFLACTFFVFALSIPLVLAQPETKENREINSIDDVKTVEDVSKYIEQVQSKLKSLPHASNEEEQKKASIKYLTVFGEALIKGGEKLISLTDNHSKQEDGVQMKIAGFKYLRSAESFEGIADPKSSKYSQQLEKYLDELTKEGKHKAAVNQEHYTNLFLIAASKDLHENFTLDNFARYFKEAKKWANTEGIKPINPLLFLLETSSTPKAIELDAEILTKTIDEIFEFIRSDELKVSEEQKKETIVQIEGFQKRLLGSDPELYGKTLDGLDFDWSNLRNKYVLVKFTASWCGPCKGEIPFMIKAYEKYRDKGFEIVSVYVWDKLDATKKAVEDEKLNWIILSEELTEKAGLPKQGTRYAIRGVPTMFLIDKNGKIISTTVRGEKLEETLSKLFNEPDTNKQQD